MAAAACNAGEFHANVLLVISPFPPSFAHKAKTKSCFLHVTQVDFMPVYAEHLRNIIKQGVDRKDNFDKPLEGFKIAVDPGNGAGGYFATNVLQPLGCDVSGAFL